MGCSGKALLGLASSTESLVLVASVGFWGRRLQHPGPSLHHLGLSQSQSALAHWLACFSSNQLCLMLGWTLCQGSASLGSASSSLGSHNAGHLNSPSIHLCLFLLFCAAYTFSPVSHKNQCGYPWPSPRILH